MIAEVLKAIAVTCELTNTELSESAVMLMAESLAAYPEPQVLSALKKCCKELKSRLTLADVLSRLDDGRPGVEEAWSMVTKILHDERASLVWTDEMREAYGCAAPLADDPVAARLAFKERYMALMSDARDHFQPVNWSASLGYDKTLRADALTEAVMKNRISVDYAKKLIPQAEEMCALTTDLTKRIGDDMPPLLGAH